MKSNHLFAALFAGLAVATSISADPVPQSASKPNPISYPNVASARKALLARPDAQSRTEGGGWLIVEIPSEMTMWTFTPETDPAYPAVVRRIITQGPDGVNISMDVLCEASKDACDKLVKQFQDSTKR